jgi:hypothetical protein
VLQNVPLAHGTSPVIQQPRINAASMELMAKIKEKFGCSKMAGIQ